MAGDDLADFWRNFMTMPDLHAAGIPDVVSRYRTGGISVNCSGRHTGEYYAEFIRHYWWHPLSD